MDGKDPKEVVLATIMAAVDNDRIAADLRLVYDMIEKEGATDGEELLGKMSEELTQMIVEGPLASDFIGNFEGDEDALKERLEDLVKEVTAFLWLHRIHMGVQRYGQTVNALEQVFRLKQEMDRVSDFQDENA
jgi:hypothetical protein